VSVGVSYTGFERWVLATDVRYVDFHHTPSFDNSGFDASGAATGLGWQSVVCVAAGAQYKLTDALALRVGYSWNQSPVTDSQTAFNVASPTILRHTVYAGASYSVTPCFLLSISYAHGFETSVTGPYITPQGVLPFSSIRSEVSADSVQLGATVKF
jgi:long-chain fatty acid transport protein